MNSFHEGVLLHAPGQEIMMVLWVMPPSPVSCTLEFWGVDRTSHKVKQKGGRKGGGRTLTYKEARPSAILDDEMALQKP